MDRYHLKKRGTSWHLNREGAEHPLLTFPTKGMAVAQCGDSFQGRSVSLKVHRDDGTVEEERTYPRSSRIS